MKHQQQAAVDPGTPMIGLMYTIYLMLIAIYKFIQSIHIYIAAYMYSHTIIYIYTYLYYIACDKKVYMSILQDIHIDI